MFKRLRNQFMILSMTVTALVMAVAFCAVYWATARNVYLENRQFIMAGTQPLMISGQGMGELEIIQGDGLTTWKSNMDQAGMYTLNVRVDERGLVLQVDNRLDLPEETYLRMTQNVLDSGQTEGTFTQDGRVWQYTVDQVPDMLMVAPGQGAVNVEGQSTITFMDATQSAQTLQNLLMTLLFVGALMLGVIFLISLLFSNRAIRPVRQAWQKQRQFISDASHELKTPLTIIQSNYGALMANKDDTIERQIKWLDYIKAGSERMARLVGDMLELARMDDAGVAYKREEFDCAKILREAVLAMEAAAQARDIQVRQDFTQAATLNSDPERLSQVATILLDNAVKYTDKGGLIEVALWASRKNVGFSVANSGPGIPVSDLERIFERFARGDESRDFTNQGYGLGLPIARGIVEALGGRITAESEPGMRTVFTVTLPA